MAMTFCACRAQQIENKMFRHSCFNKLLICRPIHTTCISNYKVVPKGKKGSSAEWLTRQLSDPFVDLAKQQNYRCRSAFKLIDINEKTSIIQPGHVIVDCGAAPGSWSQVAVQKSNADGKMKNKPKGMVVSVDLQHIYPIEGAHIIGNTDFTLPESQERIKKALGDQLINCVISDMAPKATGIGCLDKENIITLCYTVLRFAILMSTQGASCLVKTWDCGEVSMLEKNMLKFYKTVKRIKPPASRSDSAELFLLARGLYGKESETVLETKT